MKKKTHTLARKTFIPSPMDRIFEFFSRAENLDRITPPWLHFKVLTKIPIHMEKGTLIDYALKLHGLPIRWKSQITKWEPPHLFVDTQIKGPYTIWIHQHHFRKQNGGTVMEDIVEYGVPGCILEPLIHFVFVRRDLDQIFDYREKSLVKIFSESQK
jgi:ligand-binding SRPBCC domain-containing protein